MWLEQIREPGDLRDKSYDDLEIREGGQASLEFLRGPLRYRY